ncbi:MAG: 6-phosphogluconolactonase, partial [Verrucomicrobiales bacterium]
MSDHKPLEPAREILRTERFVEDAVDLIITTAKNSVRDRGEFRLSLCGGSTPAVVYRALAEIEGFPWEKTVITFGDERCVGPDHERSNYKMAQEALLSHVPIPANQVLRMEGELGAEEGAQLYEANLKARAEASGDAIFAHDLLLLGMGDDGHTASLFPETTALDESDRWVVENYVPKFDEHRITFTYPLINAARHVCFLITGEAKRTIYEEIFAG